VVVSDGVVRERALDTYEAGPGSEKRYNAQMRMISLAAGILVGLRCRRWEDEIVELIEVAQGCRMSPYELAKALVDLASGAQVTSEAYRLHPALRIVRRQWGYLLNASPGRTSVAGKRHA
jgi:hypothetical protein